MSDKWRDILSRMMEAHREAPPDGLWDDIERALDRAAARRSRRRRIFYWSSGSAAAAAVAALFFFTGGGGLENNPVEPLAPIVADEYREPVQEPVSEPLPSPSPSSPSQEIPAREPYAATTPNTVAEPRLAIPSGVEEPLARPIDETPRERPVTETDPVAEKHPPLAEPPAPAKGSSNGNARPIDNFGPYPGGHTPKSKRRRWQAGLYASNLASTGSSGKSNDKMYAPSESSVFADYPHTTGSSVAGQDFFYMSRETLFTDVTHRLPVTVGVSVSYGLGDRWSLASGATWTMLSSRSRAAGGLFRESREQTLHYIGIPLDIRYDLWSGGSLSVYLSAGGQVEKSVSGTQTYTLLEEAGEDSKRRISISDRAQWSVRGSAGVQYDFTKTTGIYAEPGVNYYFDNGSAIETVYKAKPFNFGLRLGLRFSL